MTVNLGDKVRDRITGFEGIAVARTEWIFGCVRITVQPPVNGEGKLPETQTFDLDAIETLHAGPVTAKQTGGPRDDRAALRR